MKQDADLIHLTSPYFAAEEHRTREGARCQRSYAPLELGETYPFGGMLDTSFRALQPGGFVTFALDSSYLANRFKIGSFGYEALLRYQPSKYVGLVTSSYAYTTMDGQVKQEVIIHFTMSPKSSTLAPINRYGLPNSSRPPLQMVKGSFWPNACQLTTIGVRAIVTTLHPSHGWSQPRLKEAELERWAKAAVEDDISLSVLLKTQSGEATRMIQDVEALRSMDCPLPVQIWTYVGSTHADPPRFLDDVRRVNGLVEYHSWEP